MNNLPTDQEIDSFFDKLSNQYPIKQKCPPPSPPSQELLDLAWEAAKAHRQYLIQNGLAFAQHIIPMAASDGEHTNTAMRFKCKMPQSVGGEWSLSRETIPQDPDWQFLKFKCHPDLIETVFKGRQVEVRIGGESYSLGQVNKRGIAETKIPTGLDLHQEIEVRFSAK